MCKIVERTYGKNKDWEKFEIVVSNFLSTLDSSAKVVHNTKTVDKDTDQLRQRDVWISSTICGFPIKILVSCKYWNTSLDVSDIDTFICELNASEAHTGVIYSKTGYTKNALIKAKKHDIGCCVLFHDSEIDIPESLILKQYYCNTKIFIKSLKKPNNAIIWNDLFKLKKGSKTLLDEIVLCFKKMEKHSLKHENTENSIPRDWSIEYVYIDNEVNEVRLKLTLAYKIYESKLTGYLANGSYNFTDNKFVGTQNGPIINIQSSDPGEDWELLTERPNIKNNTAVLVASGTDYYKNIKDGLGSQEIR